MTSKLLFYIIILLHAFSQTLACFLEVVNISSVRIFACCCRKVPFFDRVYILSATSDFPLHVLAPYGVQHLPRQMRP